jgi:hypothetical protein
MNAEERVAARTERTNIKPAETMDGAAQMMRMSANNIVRVLIYASVLACTIAAAQDGKAISKDSFKNPPPIYRPIATLGAGGDGNTLPSNWRERLKVLYIEKGFGGVMVAPSSKPQPATSAAAIAALPHAIGLPKARPAGASPWTMIAPPGTPGGLGLDLAAAAVSQSATAQLKEPALDYLSTEYFQRLRELLEYSQQEGRYAVFYDETGFPSGFANHTTPPHLNRKVLQKTEEALSGPRAYELQLPGDGVLMAVVAMNGDSRERIDLRPYVRAGSLQWEAPVGNWKVMVFTSVAAKARGAGVDYSGAVDYLDPTAVQWFLDTAYEPHARHIGEHFGRTLNMTFFDDVGIFNTEKMWTARFNEAFRARVGQDPAIYYPALWEDIGPQTQAARVAFFDTRAELLANGFPKIVSDWGAKQGVEVSGHAPGNYDIQPVDMNADPFKFYRAQPIPMADVIFAYPLGREGFKLISDGADYYDKPIVAAETFEPFAPGGQEAGYRRLMELYVHGINRLVGAGQSREPAIGGPATFAEWAGRNSLLLQGGQRVSEIAVFYPIAALQAFYRFDAPEYTREMAYGTFVPHDTDYLAVGGMLANEVHRGFTFLHPDVLLSDKVRVEGRSLVLQNEVNRQQYQALILPGQQVISLQALRKIKAYFDAGGSIVATSLLPSKAAELAPDLAGTLANDAAVRALVEQMFGIDSSKPMPEGMSAIHRGAGKGQAIFIRTPTAARLEEALAKLGATPDVRFAPNPTPASGGGVFSYIHKRKEGREIYFFANSSDAAIDTVAELRGRIEPEFWNPLSGDVARPSEVKHIKRAGETYTRVALKLDAVQAMFVVGRAKN